MATKCSGDQVVHREVEVSVDGLPLIVTIGATHLSIRQKGMKKNKGRPMNDLAYEALFKLQQPKHGDHLSALLAPDDGKDELNPVPPSDPLDAEEEYD